MSSREMAKPGQEAPLRQTAPVERLAEQTREWFAAAQRDSYERTRIATGLKFMWRLQREAWLRGNRTTDPLIHRHALRAPPW